MPSYKITVEDLDGDFLSKIFEGDENATVKLMYEYLLESLRQKRWEQRKKEHVWVYENYGKDAMASMYEVVEMFTLFDIELVKQCYGCENNLPGQNEHMDCEGGCLHDANTCKYCTEN